MRSISLTLCAGLLVLSACSHKAVVINATPPGAFLAQCPQLPHPEGDMTAEEALRDALEVSGRYEECRAVHNALVEWHLKE